MGTIEKIIKAIFDITKIPSLLFLVFAGTGTFIFYFSEYVVVSIDKKSDIYLYAYLLYCVSVAVVFISICLYIIKKIKYIYYYFKVRSNFKFEIKTLNEPEKAVLREFYMSDAYSLKLPYDDSTVSGLISKRILISTSPFSNAMLLSGNTSTYKIGDYVRKIINPSNDLDCFYNLSDSQLQNISPDDVSKYYQAIDRIESLRPIWAKRH